MAKTRILTTSDDYFPEFWPAKKVIGELELAVIKAEKIIGKITSEQIASLEAGKITGQITNAQIKELEAAKLAGQITSAQIKELEANKIAGQLLSAQIAGLAAVKIEGLLTSAQIESLSATKVTGLITNAQIEALAASKLTGTISETQIGPEAVTTPKLKAAAVETAKLAVNAVTAEKITALNVTTEKLAAEAVTVGKLGAESVSTAKLLALNVTAGKLAAESVEAGKIKVEAVETNKIKALAITAGKIEVGAIIAEKLGVGAVTAEKILAESVTALKIAGEAIEAKHILVHSITANKFLVEELSAITANVGILKSGIIEGPIIRTTAEKPKLQLDSTGLFIEDAAGLKRVKITAAGGLGIMEKTLGELTSLSWSNEAGTVKEAIYGLLEAGPTHILLMECQGTSSKAKLEVRGSDTAGTEATVRVVIGSEIKEVFTSLEKSHFLQLAAGLQKSKIAKGSGTLTYPAAGSNSNELTVEVPTMGGTPTQVLLTVTGGTSGFNSWIRTTAKEANKFKVVATNPGVPGVTGTVNFDWIAVT